jgi:hypothetical protein
MVYWNVCQFLLTSPGHLIRMRHPPQPQRTERETHFLTSGGATPGRHESQRRQERTPLPAAQRRMQRQGQQVGRDRPGACFSDRERKGGLGGHRILMPLNVQVHDGL